MSTGLVDSWLKVDTLGPIYPFVGTEMIMVIAGIAFWLIWHVVQIKKEKAEFEEDIKRIKDRGGVDKVLAEESKREVGDSIGS